MQSNNEKCRSVLLQMIDCVGLKGASEVPTANNWVSPMALIFSLAKILSNLSI